MDRDSGRKDGEEDKWTDKQWTEGGTGGQMDRRRDTGTATVLRMEGGKGDRQPFPQRLTLPDNLRMRPGAQVRASGGRVLSSRTRGLLGREGGATGLGWGGGNRDVPWAWGVA